MKKKEIKGEGRKEEKRKRKEEGRKKDEGRRERGKSK